jgi:hypothetical protein
MTERPAERTASRPRVDPPTKRPAEQAKRPAEQAKRPAAGSDDTAARAPLAERIQAKLSQATEEHRANARAETAPATKKTAGRKPPRRARLRLTRIDPWSVMKTAFLLSVALGVVTVVSVLMVWSVLGAAGVWESINSAVQDILGGESAGTFDIEDYIGTSRVLGFTMLVAVIDVVLLTAIATLGAFLYNMTAALLGGVEVTLAEDN